jgi:ankyrin repeat protein
MTALHWAAAAGRLPVVEVLLSAGANPSLQSWFMLTAGQIADANRHRSVADRLFKLDPSPLDGWKVKAVLLRMGLIRSERSPD